MFIKEVSMMIKNTIIAFSIAACAIPVSTQCMLNGVKAVVSGIGSAIGIGLPTVPFFTIAGIAYKSASNPEQFIEQMNDLTEKADLITREAFGASFYTPEEQKLFGQKTYAPSAQEEAFLRQYIPNSTRIIMNHRPDSSVAVPSSNAIIMENRTFASNRTLEQALEQQDHEALQAFAAIAQHEKEHIKNRDDLKKRVPMVLLPVATTTAAVAIAKKLFPYNKKSSLVRHIGRFGAKTVGGAALLAANTGLALYTLQQISHIAEYNADKGITPDNIDGFEKDLLAGEQRDDRLYDTLAKKVGPLKPQWFNTRKVWHQIDHLSHPSPEDRIAALRTHYADPIKLDTRELKKC
jgi:hypothetical protein